MISIFCMCLAELIWIPHHITRFAQVVFHSACAYTEGPGLCGRKIFVPLRPGQTAATRPLESGDLGGRSAGRKSRRWQQKPPLAAKAANSMSWKSPDVFWHGSGGKRLQPRSEAEHARQKRRRGLPRRVQSLGEPAGCLPELASWAERNR
jgi:hypothetical protein